MSHLSLGDFRAILLEHEGDRYIVRNNEWVKVWRTMEQDIIYTIVVCIEFGDIPTEEQIREGTGLGIDDEFMESMAEDGLVVSANDGWYPTIRAVAEFLID